MSLLAFGQKLVVDKDGSPLEVIIPYEKFIEFIEAYGLDLSEDDLEGIREADADLASGNRDAFVSLEEVERELAERED